MFNFNLKSLGFIFALASTLIATPTWAANLSFSLSPSSVNIGQTLNVDIFINDLSSTQDLSAFDFNVNFDASLLNFNSYTLTDALGNLAASDAIDVSGSLISNGKVNLSEVSFLFDLSAQADSFKIATLNFTGFSAGNSALSFSDVTLGDAFGDALPASLISNSVQVAAVPEPTTYALLLTGLALVVGISRRRPV